jgi:hypothetical protein
MTKKVVIAHFDKDINWVSEINKDIEFEVYSTSHTNINGITNNKIFFISPNKGMDSNMYLKFILNNYDNLPDKILFVHHHFMDWSQDFSLPFIINNLIWEYSDYINVGKRNCYGNIYEMYDKKYLHVKDWFKFVWPIFDGYLEFPEKNLFYYAGTQFMVNKELILQYPKSFYQNLHNWVIQTDMEDYKVGRIFEYLWHYIFTKNTIDKKFNNNEIFKL